ncbi:MAG: acetylxylan esterase [Saprospiraceae bacterium]|nr:acetylxylan esterase [Saprospiraceae bacterium]
MRKICLLCIILSFQLLILGQTRSGDASEIPPLVTYTSEEDHAQMMNQLGIRKLRSGASGNESAPNHANYEESLANPCPVLLELLLTATGVPVNSADTWWNIRRPEIKEDLEREIYGRLPDRVPEVNWTVKITDREFVGRVPVIVRQLIGHVDNRAYPSIEVHINMMVVLPTNVQGPVPVLMMFGRPSFPAPAQPSQADLEALNLSFKKMMIQYDPKMKEIFDRYPAYSPITRLPPPNFFAPPVTGDSPRTEQLLAAGWGYATIDPRSIQADNGAGLTRGIIGLTNRGKLRSPDDWGALRAWAWGASRGLDYLQTDTLVASDKIGIEGVSRYGKAALVALAFEPRFATGLIGSSGKGGATLHRRVFGEAVENLTGPGEYHWMAGNYLKYGASEASFGSMSGCDLPTDAHALIALCAPRLTFISYGIPEKGDAKWLDQQGSYMATVAAASAFRLLGARGIGVSDDYMAEKMPPVLTGKLNGELAWRQHDGGHTDAPNFAYFIPWANRFLKYERISK